MTWIWFSYFIWCFVQNFYTFLAAIFSYFSYHFLQFFFFCIPLPASDETYFSRSARNSFHIPLSQAKIKFSSSSLLSSSLFSPQPLSFFSHAPESVRSQSNLILTSFQKFFLHLITPGFSFFHPQIGEFYKYMLYSLIALPFSWTPRRIISASSAFPRSHSNCSSLLHFSALLFLISSSLLLLFLRSFFSESSSLFIHVSLFPFSFSFGLISATFLFLPDLSH